MSLVRWAKGISINLETGEGRLHPGKLRKAKLTPLSKAIKPEQQLQINIVDFIRIVAPQCIVYHIPNEGKWSVMMRIRLIRMGLWPGVGDLALLSPYKLPTGEIVWKTHFIEVKAPGGRMSQNQEKFKIDCMKLSIPYACVHNIDGVRTALEHWGIPTKETSIIK